MLSLSNIAIKILNLKSQLIDYTPRNQMLFGQPGSSFRVCCFPKEDCQMKKVPELIALINVNINAWCLFSTSLMFNVRIERTDKLPVLLNFLKG